MIKVSKDYKEIMSRPVRNRSFLSVGIGIINQNAQQDGKANGDFAYWSKGNIFDPNQTRVQYATLEEDYMPTDGSMVFLPETNEDMQILANGIVTDGIFTPIRFDFGGLYDIKGLTLDFGPAYPTEFTVQTENNLLTYVNDKESFQTTDVLGETRHIVITPTSMVGGNQRFRIKSILMGVGLVYTNNDLKSFTIKEYNSGISEELPSEDLSLSFFDKENYFDVDNDNSFMEYLETMQKATVSFGIEKDNGEVEWNQIATTFLKSWNSQKGAVSFVATDRLAQMEDEYSLGNRIYERTAGDEARKIFADAGLAEDEYIIDSYLDGIVLRNPMPVGTHKECLQLLANACRCVLRHDEYGRVVIKPNFESVISVKDMEVSTNGETEWSNSRNILFGATVEYADMTKDFFRTDGTMYFLAENESYLNVGYVSDAISDGNGLFEINPTVSISLPASFSYAEIDMEFGGNPPEEMIIYLYKNGTVKESIRYENLKSENALIYDFADFDKITFEFLKTKPQNRVLLNKVGFGDLSDYVLTRMHMLSEPIGYKEKRVKDVRVKIFTFTEEDGNPVEVEDDVFWTKRINEVGDNRTVQNPLIGNAEQAELLAEWIGNYFANNVSYDVEYMGEPRVNASDIIYMETKEKGNIPVDVESHELTFNGRIKGRFQLRKANKMV